MRNRNISDGNDSCVWRVVFWCLIWVGVSSCISYNDHVVSGASLEDYEDRSEWYTRYAAYPPYCSTPSDMKERSVPKLSPSINSKLLHVTTIIRHGQRTPYRVVDCWDSFWEPGEETAIWNCELNTMMSPPAVPEIKVAENSPENAEDNPELAGEGSMFLFEKRYDGLSPPLGNEMNGTCQMGQLLLRGYVQELENGHILRRAYIKSNNSIVDHDDRLTLFDATQETTDEARASFYQSPNFYYRADDDQRTLMSGQVVLRGLFHPILPKKNDNNTQEDPVIVLHTADKNNDILSPNHHLCPRLTELSYNAFQSEEYQNYNKSLSVLKIRQMMEQELGKNFEYDGIDCLMTTICTDRKLPNILDDYHNKNSVNSINQKKYGSNMFDRVAELSAKSFLFPFKYNDAIYSKLAMAPLWDSILKNLIPFSSATSKSQGPKMALFSGHDTTIMPLLATLGENVWDSADWTPYASMLIMEIHEILDNGDDISVRFPTKRAFRLIYNGQILTSKVDDCPADSELCDLSILIDRIQTFATSEPDCTPRNKKDTENPNSNLDESHKQKNNPSINKNTNVTLSSLWTQIICLCLICALVSSVGTFYSLTKRLPFFNTKRSLYKETKSLPKDDVKYVDVGRCEDDKKHHRTDTHHAVEVAGTIT